MVMLSGKLDKGSGTAMELIRTTPGPFIDGKFGGQRSNEYVVGDQSVTVIFDRYGGGNKKSSDYEVRISSDDFETILEKFCEAKHPAALAIKDAQNLVAAIKAAGWRPPQSN
jgi:hypothetical protein